MRVGIGYDIHALKKGPKLLLGGVEIPHTSGLSGHSDGDVLLHAVVDALLGAAGSGDIGEYFSDKDPRWKNASSVLFAEKALKTVKEKKFKIQNIDTVVIAERPKLGAHKMRIRRSMARIFGVGIESVNIKAKTNEGFGPVGEGKAIAAMAVVTLNKGR